MPTFFHNDQLGSPVAATNAAGAVLWRETYTPYGESMQSDAAHADDIGFTGHVEDTSGLTYMQARYYDPIVGRFLSIDPVEFSAGAPGMFNRYAYAGNDPVNNIDPDGMRCVIANGDSAYCMRRDIYRVFDRLVGGSTRFFGAAAATVEYLANNDIPILGNVLSDQAEGFLRDVSASLYSLNANALTRIQRGELAGPDLDQRMVHMEQTRVQEMLDALPPEKRAAIIASINEGFNSPLRGASDVLSSSDARYNRVLSGVVRDLGRPIDFANQGDREAIGNAVIRDLRKQGGCTPTGTRIARC